MLESALVNEGYIFEVHDSPHSHPHVDHGARRSVVQSYSEPRQAHKKESKDQRRRLSRGRARVWVLFPRSTHMVPASQRWRSSIATKLCVEVSVSWLPPTASPADAGRLGYVLDTRGGATGYPDRSARPDAVGRDARRKSLRGIWLWAARPEREVDTGG